jgi:hypothetical protein
MCRKNFPLKFDDFFTKIRLLLLYNIYNLIQIHVKYKYIRWGDACTEQTYATRIEHMHDKLHIYAAFFISILNL